MVQQALHRQMGVIITSTADKGGKYCKGTNPKRASMTSFPELPPSPTASCNAVFPLLKRIQQAKITTHDSTYHTLDITILWLTQQVMLY